MRQDNRLIYYQIITWVLAVTTFISSPVFAGKKFSTLIYDQGYLKPIDSQLKVKIGDHAPDFKLKSVRGPIISLSELEGKKNVVLSFVPAAWTPICSDQWPGYAISKTIFDKYDAMLLGITVDNVPTLFAWTQQMGKLWFDVLSDFWPHGSVAADYGVLRGDGTSERALIFIDKNGKIRGTHVSDINVRPDLGIIIEELENMQE